MLPTTKDFKIKLQSFLQSPLSPFPTKTLLSMMLFHDFSCSGTPLERSPITHRTMWFKHVYSGYYALGLALNPVL